VIGGWKNCVLRSFIILSIHRVQLEWPDQRGMRPLGRPSRRWELNVKMGLRETIWDVMG
jgi:hypothetical protein